MGSATGRATKTDEEETQERALVVDEEWNASATTTDEEDQERAPVDAAE